jgi:hypothetical protein
MAAERRPDRLDRDELLALQHKALREWRESPWLAEHHPRVALALEAQAGDQVRVDLGGGVGESEQEPGYLVLDNRADVPTRTQLAELTGETRLPDLDWNLVNGLPFEDRTVDAVYAAQLLDALPQTARDRLPDELGRVVRVGGEVRLRDDPKAVARLVKQLAAQGFAVEDDDTDRTKTRRRVRLVLTRAVSPLDAIAPRLVDATVLGHHELPAPPRVPVPA